MKKIVVIQDREYVAEPLGHTAYARAGASIGYVPGQTPHLENLMALTAMRLSLKPVRGEKDGGVALEQAPLLGRVVPESVVDAACAAGLADEILTVALSAIRPPSESHAKN